MLFVHYCNVMVYVVYCVASGKQEKVQACLVTLWLFIISCHSLYKTTLGSLCSWKPAWSLKKRPHSMCLTMAWVGYYTPHLWRCDNIFCCLACDCASTDNCFHTAKVIEIRIFFSWNPLWKCVSLWLSKSFGRYANIENNNDDDDDGDDDGDGDDDDDDDGDGDDDPCKNALTAPEPLLASAHSFSNISTILVLKNTKKISFNIWLLYFLKFSTCHSEQHDLKIIHIFINTQQIFMFNVSI